jgi:hypothetical protein
MKTWTMRALTILLVGCSAACAQHQELASSPGDAAMTELPSQVCSTSSVDAGTPPPIVAVWDGYMEESFVATGNDQVHVVIRSSDTGQLSATAVFGAPAAPPPLPTNSNSCDPVDPVMTAATPSAGSLQLLEGFEYQVAGLTVSDIRLKFNVLTYQPLASWCACQVPIADSMFCVPNNANMTTVADGGMSCTYAIFDDKGRTTERIVAPCCRIQRCESYQCLCDQSGCSYNTAYLTTFDLNVNGTHADGNALHLLKTQ